MFHRTSGGDLSVLARGRGLVGGGVEIECFADDRKAFTLTGQSFLMPADSDTGKHAKPYRAHKLALPKTYITKRGQMVLFTSPDDMVIGRSCQVHQREVTSKQAARELRTTENLVNTALNYKTEKDSSMISGDVSSDVMQQCPGSFTNVYLQSLQLAAQKAKQAQVSEDCIVEDIEGKDAAGGPLVSDCDSGLGPSSGRISALSHHSDSTVITIPDGRESRLSVPADLVEEVVPAEKAPPTDPSTTLSLLKSELTGYTPQAKEKSGKKKVTKASKRQRVKSEEQKTAKVKRQTATENKKTESETSKSKQKSRRKRGKKDKEKVEASISLSVDDSQMVVGENGLYKDEGDILTAVQIPSGVVGKGPKEVDMRARRAEERRLEVERKRAEKRELELQKQREEEERARLQEELRRVEEERLQREAMAVETGSAESDQESEETSAAVDTSILSRLEEDGFVDNRLALLAEQEEARLRERRLLLAYAAEREEERRRKEMEEAEEELRKARELEEAIERKKREQEEQEKEERRKEEAAARAKAAMEKAEKLRKEQNYKNHFELASHRRFQSISRSYVFSYFNYVPPSRPKGDKKGKRTRQRPTRKK